MTGSDNMLSFSFYRFLSSRVLISVSYVFFLVFFMWKVVQEYHSVFLAGMIPTIYMLVDLVTAVPIGYAIDRMNNSVLSTLSGVVMVGGFGVFALGSSFYIVYLATAIVALGRTLAGDSFAALIKKLVKPDGITKATALSSMGTSVSSLIGVAFGGIALIYLSRYSTLILVSIAIAATILAFPVRMATGDPVTQEEGKKKGYREVLSFFRSILGFVTIALVVNGFFVSLDVYASGLFNLYLDTSPIYYTLFEAALPGAMIIGSYFADRYSKYLDKPAMISVTISLLAPIILLIGISRNAMLDVIASGMIGFILPLVNVPLISRLTKFTPVELFGRVMAFLRIFIQGSTPVMASVFSFATLFFTVPNILVAVGAMLVPFALFGLGAMKTFYARTEMESKAA